MHKFVRATINVRLPVVIYITGEFVIGVFEAGDCAATHTVLRKLSDTTVPASRGCGHLHRDNGLSI